MINFTQQFKKIGSNFALVFLLSIFSIALLTNNSYAQTCTSGAPGAFSPLTFSANETCPGLANGSVTLLGFTNTAPPTYDYCFDWYINGIYAGVSGCVNASFFASGTFTPATSNTLTGLSNGDVISIQTCSADGKRGTNGVGTIGLDGLLPNEPLLSPAGTSSLCGGVGSITLSASELNTLGEAWSSSMTYQWTLGGVPIFGATGTGLPPATYNATTTGTYNIIISNNCTVTDPASISITNISLTATATTVTAVSCFGASDGEVMVTPAGGSAYTYSWNDPNSQTTTNATGLAAGVLFTVTVTEQPSTCTVTASISLTTPTPSITVTVDAIRDEGCVGASDGSVTVTGSGGVPMYNWTGSNGSSGGPSITEIGAGLTAGIYTITGTDQNGCKDIVSVTISNPPPLTVTAAELTPESCAGISDGVASTTTLGGNTPYVYLWSDGQTSANATGLTQGAYQVTVANIGGSCPEIRSVTITGEPALTITSAVIQHESCALANDGIINTTVTGGSGTYTYTWSNGSSTGNISTLAAGTYTVTVNSATPACQITATETITVTENITLTSVVTQNESCTGASNGIINTTVTGGATPYTYLWSNGAATSGVSGLTAGTHIVTINPGACQVTATNTITPDPNITLTSAITQHVSCALANDGIVNTTVTGGSGTYTYTWSNLATTSGISGLAANTYNVTVNSTGGVAACQQISSEVVTVTPNIILTTTITSQESCTGVSDGIINTVVTGGVTPYTYVWSNSATTSGISGLAANAYNITVNSTGGATACQVTATETITTIPSLTITSAITKNESCNGTLDGIINTTVTGGATPYTYSWSNSATTSGISGLVANTYNVTVNSTGGAIACQVTATEIITVTPALTITSAVTQNESCVGTLDGIINTTVTGGATPYTYSWSNGQITDGVSALAAGTYTVTINTATPPACQVTATQTITTVPLLTITSAVTQNESCAGTLDGIINTTVTGGTGIYTYSWSNGQVTDGISALATGTYSVTINTATPPACQVTATQTITTVPLLTITSAVTQNESCVGTLDGIINTTVTGGATPYIYSWSNSATTSGVSGLIANTYNVTVNSTGGAVACQVTATETITTIPALTITSAVTQNESCAGTLDGIINTTVTGGATPYTYSWSNGQVTTGVSALAAGTYTVTINTATPPACQVTATQTITTVPLLTITSAVTQNESCAGTLDGIINTTVTGGTGTYTYSWSNGQITDGISALATGTYTVTINTATPPACQVTATETITTVPLLTITSAITKNESCTNASDGIITTTVTGGATPYTYLWSNGATTNGISGLTANTYNVTVNSTGGVTACQVTTTETITVTPALTITSAITQNESCTNASDGIVNTTVTGGTGTYTYTWSNNGITSGLSGLTAGTYTVTINTATPAVCQVTSTEIIIPTSALTITSAVTQNESCTGTIDGIINTTVTGGTGIYTYSWSNAATTDGISALAAGTYTVTINTATPATCQVTATETITAVPLLTITSAVTKNESCAGTVDGIINTTVTGGATPYTYSWSNAATTDGISGLATGTYTVTINTATPAACQVTATETITTIPLLTLTSAITQNQSCAAANDGIINTTVTGGAIPYTYLWSNGATTNGISGLAPNTYNVTVNSTGGATACQVTTTETIIVSPNVTITSSGTDPTCSASSNGTINITVTGGTSNYSFLWSNGSIVENLSNLNCGNFTVTVTDNNPLCTTTNSVSLTCPSALTITMSNTPETCPGNSDGTATASVSGGNTNYSYQWDATTNNQTTATATGLSPNTYNVTVIDGGSSACSITNSVTVTTAPLYTVTTTSTNETCFGFNNGTASITVTSGGTSPYNFQWSSGGTTNAVLSDTEVGLSNTVTVTVNDALLACALPFTITLNPATQITLTANVTQNISCNSGTDGAVSASAAGGVTPYTYSWSSGNTGTPITGLNAGSITITAQDANLCSITDVLTITQPTAITATTSITDAICGASDGVASVFNIGGGAGGYTFNWSPGLANGQITSTAVGLNGGAYSVTVSDASTCTGIFAANLSDIGGDTITVTSSINVSCVGANDGSVTIDTSCVNAPCTFIWLDKNNVQLPALNNLLTVTGLNPGKYYIQLTNGAPCTDLDSVTIAPADTIFPNTTTTDILCFGLSTGTISFPATGGTSPYSYSWSHNGTETTSNVSGLPSGSYTITITENSANTCDTIVNVTLTQPLSALTFTASINNSTCGNSDGSINIVTSGGTVGSGYSYIWSPGGETTEDLNTQFAGSFSQTITDNNNCTITHTENILDIGAPTVTVNPVTECYNTCGAALASTITAGTTGYTTVWSNGQTTATATGLCPNTYTLTVTDDNGCSSITTTTVTPTDSIFANETITNISCNGFTDGSITTAATAGISTTFTYLWGGGQTTSSLAGLSVGIYTLTLSNTTCSDAFSYTITTPPALTVTQAQTEPSCNGFSDGIATVTVTGGVTPYTYAWSSGGTAATETGLANGVYTVTITNNGGSCNTTNSFTLTEPSAVTATISVDNNVNCFGGSDGQASVIGAGGTLGTGYTYSWSDPLTQTTATAINLAAGIYTVTVTDGGGGNCTANNQITITVPTTALTTTVTGTNPTCDYLTNGSVTITASGGTTGYTYLWNDPSSQTTAIATGLIAGTWTGTVTDANGCTSTASTTLSSAASITISVITTPTNCTLTNGTATATVTGGASTNYTYSWNDPSTQVTNPATALSTGNINVIVTETTLGCTVTANGFVNPIGGPAITLTNSTAVSCFGGSNGALDITASGGTTPYNFVWNPAPGCGSQTTEDINCLSAGVYNVVTTDNANCPVSANFTITEAIEMLTTVTSVDATCGLCDGQMTVNTSGGTSPYNYLWSNNAADNTVTSSTQTGLCAGIIQTSITDQNGCAIQPTFGLNNIGGPTGITVTNTPATCFNAGDAQAVSTVVGGTTPYSYLWFPSNQTTATVSGLDVTVHTLEVTDANNCKIITNTTVTDPPQIVDNLTTTPTTCGGSNGTITAAISGGTGAYTYVWNVAGTTNTASTTTATGLPEGIVNLTVTDFTNCAQTFNYIMNGINAPSITLTTNDVSCFGESTGSITSTLAGGTTAYSYQWMDASLNTLGITTPNLTGISNGTYVLQVTDATPCIASQTATINQPDSVQFSNPVGVAPSCFGNSDGTANVVPIGGTVPYSFTWGGGASASGPTATGLGDGIYPVTLTDNLGCIATGSVIITAPNSIVIDTVAANTTICSSGINGSIDIIVTGGTSPYSYSWSNNATTEDISGLTAGVYTVTVIDANSCSNTLSTIIGGTTITAAITDVSCFGGNNGSINLSVTGFASPYSYQWAPPPGGSSSNVEDPLGLIAMGYAVTVTDTLGCVTDSSFQVGESPSISVTFAEVSSTCGACNGQLTVTTSGGAGGYSYLWSTNGTTAIETGLCAGLYQIDISDANACTQTFNTGLSDNNGPTNASLTLTAPSCYGVQDATACVSATGGVTPYSYSWSPGGSSPNTACTSGLTTGSINVEITDANGCKLVVDSIIDTPTQVTDSISLQSTTCGASDGSIAVFNQGGVSPYTYLWNNGNTNSSLTGLAQGAIQVTVTDATNCAFVFPYNMNGSTSPSISITANNVSCFSGSDGNASSFVSGGTTTYTYQWTDASLTPIASATTPTITGLTEGCYFLSVSDAAIPTCIATQSFCITQPDSIQFSVPSAIHPSCFNTNDGVATTIPVGGTLPYTFSWNDSNNQTNSSATGLLGGVYYVSITDNNNCLAIDSVIIVTPSTIVIDTVSANSILCSTGNDGQIDIIVSGGNSPYTYLWNNSFTTQDISGLNAGIFCVTVTDNNGCSETKCVGIGGTTITGTVSDVSCFGGNDGSINLSVTGVASPYSYQWAPPPSGSSSNIEDPLGLIAMGYIVTVTDSLGCTNTTTFQVGESPSISVTFSETSSTCGSCDGQLTANTSGGTGGFTYLWSNSGSSVTETGLCAGLYEVSITDANACSQTFSAGISDINGPTSASLTITPPSCYGVLDASACVSATGGSTPYSYAWNPAGTSPNNACTSGLTTGSLFVEISDANGCKLVVDSIIDTPTQIIDSISIQSTTCGASDGSITVFNQGGVSPYTYLWNNGNTTSSLSGLPQGISPVTVTDATSCSVVFSYNMNGSTAPSISITANNVNCFNASDGTASAFVSGGLTNYSYQWLDAAQVPIALATTATVTGLTDGCYFLSVSDAATPTCIATQSFCITQPDSIQFSVPSAIHPNCFGSSDGTATTIPIGGTLPYTFVWDDVNTQTNSSASGLAQGTYHVTITDNNSCAVSDSVTLVSPTVIVIDTVSANTILCSGGSGGQIDIIITGGNSPYTFLWSNAATTEAITGLNDGTFCVTVTDNNNCTQTKCWSVGGPSLDAAVITDALCYNSCDGIINITASGAATPFSYLWNPNGQVTETATGLCPGTYSISITDTNLCSVFVDTLTVSNPDTLKATFATTAATCGLTPCNGVITTTPLGGTAPYTYQWGDPSETTAILDSACAGVHPVSITDINGCSDVFLAGLSDIGGVDSIDLAHTNLSCNGINTGTASVTAIYGGTSPYLYSWSPTPSNAAFVTGLPEGVEFVQITDNNNCILIDNVTITAPTAITDSTIITPTTCGTNSGSLALYPSGGGGIPYTFVWSTGSPVSTSTSSTVTGLPPVVVLVTVNDNSGCSETFTYNVNPSTFVTNISAITDVTCNGFSDGSASVTISGGTTPYSYSWSSGGSSLNVSNLNAGTHIVTITDSTNCVATESVIINQPDALVLSSLVTSNVLCNGESNGTGTVDYVGGTVPYAFVWSNGTQGPVAIGLPAGLQTASVTDNKGCVETISITITEPAILLIDTTSVMSSLCTQVNTGKINTLASGGVTNYNYLWSNGQTTAIATGLTAGTHCITVTDANSCTYSVCANVTDSISIIINNINDYAICVSEDSLILVGNGVSSPSPVPVSYTWTDVVGDTLANDTVAVLNNFNAGIETYNFTTYATSNSGCFTTQIISVTINELPDVDAGADINMIVENTVTLGADPTSLSATVFTWSPSTFLNDSTLSAPAFNPNTDGEFMMNVTVTDDNGCATTDSVNIIVTPVVDIVNIFSPNGDGINDVWFIPFLDQYPEADLWIYNRWGELLFETVGGYTTPWDGTFNGKPVPVGSYYYILELNHPDVPKPITGPLAVIR